MPNKDHITYTQVRKKKELAATGPHKYLLTILKSKRMACVDTSPEARVPAKTIVQGTVQGGRKRRREKNRWEDSIKEWTRLNSVALQRGQNTGRYGNDWLESKQQCPNSHLEEHGTDEGDGEVEFSFNSTWHRRVRKGLYGPHVMFQGVFFRFARTSEKSCCLT